MELEEELEKVELRKTFAELASSNDGKEEHSTTHTLLSLYSRLSILKRTLQKSFRVCNRSLKLRRATWWSVETQAWTRPRRSRSNTATSASERAMPRLDQVTASRSTKAMLRLGDERILQTRESVTIIASAAEDPCFRRRVCDRD